MKDMQKIQLHRALMTLNKLEKRLIDTQAIELLKKARKDLSDVYYVTTIEPAIRKVAGDWSRAGAKREQNLLNS